MALLTFPLFARGFQNLCDHEHASGPDSDAQVYEVCADCDLLALQLLPFIETSDELALDRPPAADYRCIFPDFDFDFERTVQVITSRGPPVFALI